MARTNIVRPRAAYKGPGGQLKISLPLSLCLVGFEFLYVFLEIEYAKRGMQSPRTMTFSILSACGPCIEVKEMAGFFLVMHIQRIHSSSFSNVLCSSSYSVTLLQYTVQFMRLGEGLIFTSL